MHLPLDRKLSASFEDFYGSMPTSPVLRTFQEAIFNKRVTFGVLECANMLRCNHDNIMLCILPEVNGRNDITLNIEHTLIEAFCRENRIKVIKVSDAEMLFHTCVDVTYDVMRGRDLSCILVQYPPAKTPTKKTEFCYRRKSVASSVQLEVPP